MSKIPKDAPLATVTKMLGIGRYERHMLLCTGPKCCTDEAGLETWSYLKRRLAEIGFDQLPVYRTKAGCLRVCREGPVAVVYPEGTWYKLVSPEACETIIQEHLIGGRIAEQYAFAANPLPHV